MAAAKKRKPCPSCGGMFQRGRIVHRVLLTGLVRQRVCQKCAGLAVPLLASDATSRCLQCGTELAAFCHGCIAKVVDESIGGALASKLVKQTHKRRIR